MNMPLQAGDILCTRSNAWYARLIRFGAALLGRPNTVNHVAIYMGPGTDGRDRVIEDARGCGLAGCEGLPRGPLDHGQPGAAQAPEQRGAITTAATALLGTPTTGWASASR